MNSQLCAQTSFYRLLKNIREYNEVYKKSGAVHGCALCKDEKIEIFIEDVGKHNATEQLPEYAFGTDCPVLINVLYNRKTDFRNGDQGCPDGIPILFSRAGITKMGLELSQKLGGYYNFQSSGQTLFGLQWCRNSDL
ncbi:MAG: hypothetical protein CM1200mP30_11050 [Pseudomonadota bacterium]|nr:MAG: hypothetical protein CM1200mP30_11050 [Pseudomonadota bacterium]